MAVLVNHPGVEPAITITRKELTMTILIIHPGKSAESRDTLTFAEAQKIVGGYVERVHVPTGGCMLVNEEGRLRGLPLNMGATYAIGIEIVGPAILLDAEAERAVLGSGTDDEDYRDS